MAWAAIPSVLQIHQVRRAGVGGGLVVDEQVRVRGAGPALGAVVQPGGEFLLDQRGEQDRAAVEVQASVVQVGQLQVEDLAGAQAVECEQGRERGADGVVTVGQRLQSGDIDGLWQGLVVHGPTDAVGGVGEDDPAWFEDVEDGPYAADEGRAGCAGGGQDGQEVLAADLAERLVPLCPRVQRG
jgi:hypothetical protein